MNLFETEHAQLAQHLAGKLGGVYLPENINVTVSAYFARVEISQYGEKVWIHIGNSTGNLGVRAAYKPRGIDEYQVLTRRRDQIEAVIGQLIAERKAA